MHLTYDRVHQRVVALKLLLESISGSNAGGRPPVHPGQVAAVLDDPEPVFTPDFRARPTAPASGASLPASVLNADEVSGTTGSIYQAVKGSSPCDREGLATLLKQNPATADLWLRAVAGDPLLATG